MVHIHLVNLNLDLNNIKILVLFVHWASFGGTNLAGQGAAPVASLKDQDFVCLHLRDWNELLILPGSFNPQYPRL